VRSSCTDADTVRGEGRERWSGHLLDHVCGIVCCCCLLRSFSLAGAGTPLWLAERTVEELFTQGTAFDAGVIRPCLLLRSGWVEGEGAACSLRVEARRSEGREGRRVLRFCGLSSYPTTPLENTENVAYGSSNNCETACAGAEEQAAVTRCRNCSTSSASNSSTLAPKPFLCPQRRAVSSLGNLYVR
jgi:hypothetical protein